MPQMAAWAATAFQAAAAAAPAAGSAAATAATPTLTSIAMDVMTNAALAAAMSLLQPQVGGAEGTPIDWMADPDGPIPFAAGRVGVAGKIVHRDTFGPNLMYQGFITVLSGAGPIRAYLGFKGDDEAVTFNAEGAAITSQWQGEMWLRWRLGNQPDIALATPPGLKSGSVLPGWTPDHKLSGKACTMQVLGENSKRTAYQTGEPKPINLIEGLFGWDPRQDSTYPGGEGPCRLDNPATWVWLDCPILWALKWSLGLWEGPIGKGAPQVDYQVGGIGAKISGIDVAAFVAAANVAEANGWKTAAWPTTDDDKAQVLDAFLQAGGAIYAQRAGKISCIHRAAPRTSIVTISAADTAGDVQIDTAASRIDRINTIRPRYWSEEHNWQMTATTEVTADDWRAQDGGKRTRGVDFPYVPSATQAAQLATLQIAHTREGIAGVWPLMPHLQRIKPGDAFTINEPGFSLNGLKCLALNTEYDPSTAIVSVSFVSETDAKYPFALGQTSTPPPPPVLTPYDPAVAAPAEDEWTLTAETFTDNGASIPALVVSGECDNDVADAVIFEFRPVTDPVSAWAGAGIDAPTVERKEITGLTPGTQYQVAVSYRVRGRLGERRVLGPVTAGALVTPPVGEGARSPVGRSVAYPLSAPDSGTIEVAAFDAYMADGTTLSLPAGDLIGLAEDTIYGVFWREADGYEAEPQPATVHMTTGRWVFLGWQATPDALGDFTPPPPPPGGFGGSGETPAYYAEP